jgi:hypothetical protein
MNEKFHDGTKRDGLSAVGMVLIAIITAFAVISTLTGYGYKQGLLESAKIEKTPEWKTEILVYRHYTLTIENNRIVELVLDNTFDKVGCDGWNEEDDNGHNCILANTNDIQSVVEEYNLSTP